MNGQDKRLSRVEKNKKGKGNNLPREGAIWYLQGSFRALGFHMTTEAIKKYLEWFNTFF